MEKTLQPQPSPVTYEKHTFQALGNEGKSKQFCAICGLPPSNTIHHSISGEPVKQLDRITREQMFMEIVQVVRKRSTCNRGHVAALIVVDGRIVSMGYNGAPPREKHCTEVGCDPEDGCERTIHAEANAIAWAARAGAKVRGGTMYASHSPCLSCAKLILSAGIRTFIYAEDYRLGRNDVLEAGGVGVKKV